MIEDDEKIVASLRDGGMEAIAGNGTRADVLVAANLANARQLFVAIANCFEAGRIIERARALNPALKIVARAHTDGDVTHLTSEGADVVVIGAREIARGMMES